MLQQLSVEGDSCEYTLVLEKSRYFKHNLWHFNLSV